MREKVVMSLFLSILETKKAVDVLGAEKRERDLGCKKELKSFN